MKKISRRTFLKGAGAATLASVAAACSSDTSTSSTSTSTSSSTASSSTDSADEAVSYSGTVSVIAEAISVMAAETAMVEYQKMYPDVSLETIVVADATDFATTITAKIGASDLPDIWITQVSSALGEYAINGYLRPITDLGVQDTLIDGDTSLMEEDGETYANPMSLSLSGVFANKEIMDQLGVSYDPPPYCMDEFLSLCQQLQDAGLAEPIALAAKDTSPATAFVFQYVYQNVYGLEPDWYAKVLSGEMFWNGPEFMQTYYDYELLLPYCNADMLGCDADAGVKKLILNEAAFYIDGTGSLPTIRGYAPDMDITMFSPPFANDVANMSAVTNFDAAVCMSSMTADEALCCDFYKTLFSPEVYSLASEASSLLPTVIGATTPTDASLTVALEELANGMPASPMLSREWISGIKEIMKTGSQDFLSGVSVEQVCDNIEAEHQRLMAASPDYVTSFLEDYEWSV